MRDVEYTNETEEKGMSSLDIDQKITSFLQRKEAEFPELAFSGRHESRTVKYASQLRTSGQVLFTR